MLNGTSSTKPIRIESYSCTSHSRLYTTNQLFDTTSLSAAMTLHTIPLEPLSIPADHSDPNHPHFPSALEHQSGTRHQRFNKKRVLIAGSIVTIILVIVAGIIWGVACTRSNTSIAETVQPTLTATRSIKAPVRFHTTYEKATTFVYVTAPPLLATSSINIPQTTRAPDAPLRPTTASTDSSVATSGDL